MSKRPGGEGEAGCWSQQMQEQNEQKPRYL